jgi:hypothetical protein
MRSGRVHIAVLAVIGAAALAALVVWSMRMPPPPPPPEPVPVVAPVMELLDRVAEAPNGAVSPDDVSAFVSLGASEPLAALRIFDMTEQDLAALAENERAATLRTYEARGGLVRRLAEAAVAESQGLRARGDAVGAERWLAALDRYVAANRHDGVLEVGRDAMDSVSGLVAGARADAKAEPSVPAPAAGEQPQ